jgi:hypothetical protein
MLEGSSDRAEFLWNVHSYMNEYIRFADAKAGLVVAWASAMLGALAGARLHDKIDANLQGAFCLAGVLSLLIAFALAFWSIVPRLWTRQPIGYIFWKSILAHKSKDQFVSGIMAQSADELNGQVAGHVFDLAGICDAKFSYVNISIIFAFVGSVLSGVMYLALV